jgi:RNA polymerase sigma factor (sigma-70 family)
MNDNGAAIDRLHGRAAAFEVLTARSEAPLRAFVRQSPAAHLADDFVQRTFLKAWRCAKFDPARPDARAYLFCIAENLIKDWVRSPERSSISLDLLSARGSVVPSLPDHRARDPLARIMAQESAEALRAAMERLAPRQREVLERFYLKGEGTQGEIARSMAVTVATFNNELNRARMALKKLLRPPAPPGADHQPGGGGPRRPESRPTAREGGEGSA